MLYQGWNSERSVRLMVIPPGPLARSSPSPVNIKEPNTESHLDIARNYGNTQFIATTRSGSADVIVAKWRSVESNATGEPKSAKPNVAESNVANAVPRFQFHSPIACISSSPWRWNAIGWIDLKHASVANSNGCANEPHTTNLATRPTALRRTQHLRKQVGTALSRGEESYCWTRSCH